MIHTWLQAHVRRVLSAARVRRLLGESASQRLIASVYRCTRSRREFFRWKRAAIRVQAALRGYAALVRYYGCVLSIILLQAHSRRMLNMRQLRSARTGATKMNAVMRGALVRTRARRACAAQRIQSAVRMRAARIALDRHRCRLKLQLSAALALQRMFFVHRERRRTLRAAKLVQRFARWCCSAARVPHRRAVLHACASLARDPKHVSTALTACSNLTKFFSIPG